MAAAVSPNNRLNQAWRNYTDTENLLKLLLNPKEMAGSIASHIDLLEMKIKMLRQNPEIMKGTFEAFIETQMQVLEMAQKASETGQEVIDNLHNAITSDPKNPKKFPFENQVKKLTDLMVRVDGRATALWNLLSEGLYEVEVLKEKASRKQAERALTDEECSSYPKTVLTIQKEAL